MRCRREPKRHKTMKSSGPSALAVCAKRGSGGNPATSGDRHVAARATLAVLDLDADAGVRAVDVDDEDAAALFEEAGVSTK